MPDRYLSHPELARLSSWPGEIAFGGGARRMEEPDKAIHVPADPNAAPVKGDVARRPAAVTDDPTAMPKGPVPVTVTSSQGRRIVVPKDDRGQ
jgi:hypothetical protein